MPAIGRAVMLNLFRLVIALCAACTAASPASANPTLVVDIETGAVLHADEAGLPWYPASLTKLMTAYVTFERLRDDREFSLKTELEVSQLAGAQPPSKMGMEPGTRISVARALDALVIYSANDIAYVLAEGVAGSVPAFVERMNATASRLGMTATTFRNPNGLPDEGQISTARDLAILARALIADFPEHAAIFANPVLQWGKRSLRARNSLLRTFDGADGMKTGFICASGFNVVATATRDGRRLMAVVLGAASGNFRSQIAANLLETAFGRGAAPAIEYGTVDTLANVETGPGGPADLRPQICARSGAHPQVVKPGQLEGWGTLFGHFDTKKAASARLQSTLRVLRGTIDHGLAAVVPGAGQSGQAAVLAGLSVDEALAICDHLAKAGMDCAPLAPGEVNGPAAM
jgi:D-alanyl-D-alanine carboxypeptidase